MSSTRLFTLLSWVMVASLLLAACAVEGATPIPETQIVTETVEVTATPVVEKEGEQVAETKAPVIAPEFKNPDTYMGFGGYSLNTLDPAWSSVWDDIVIESNIYEGMVWFNKGRADEFVPVLSIGWDVNEASNVWTFKLREGVTFHEGGRLEPHDAAYSMQRALLMDRSGGLQSLALEALFGLYTIKDLAIETAGVESFEEVSQEALIATCERVKEAVLADDEAGTVTYELAWPIPWFLNLLAWPPIGAVVDMEWMVEQGAWDGDCATWVQYHDPAVEETVLFNRSNGTGPYMLDHWTAGDEIVLLANENYWRQEGDPIWEGGPSGIPSIKRLVLKTGVEQENYGALFEAGEYDILAVASHQELSRYEPYYKTLCQADGRCEEVNPSGYIQAWRDLPSDTQWFLAFNQQINVEEGNPFVGSGELDGEGIPPDFFQDVHVRRAFNYCFDFDTLIDEARNGEGIRVQGPIIAGMMGYREGEEPLYSYDLARCEGEFRQAFDGALWEEGFYVQLPYNTGGNTWRLASELLKAGVAAVNPDFVIEVVDVPGPELMNFWQAGELPIVQNGWYPDFYDPHSLVHALLHSKGGNSSAINMPEEVAAEYDALIEEGVSLTTVEERRPIYEQIQLKAQEDAVYIWMYQPVGWVHFQAWIKGYYYNPTIPTYYYALSKEAP